MPGSARRCPRLGVHAPPEILPACLGDPDLGIGYRAGTFLEDVQEDDQPPAAAVQNAVKVAAIVGAQFAQFSLDLRAVREREMGHLVAEHVEPVDLVVEHHLPFRMQRVDEVVDGLGAIGIAVVDSAEVGHRRLLDSSGVSIGQVDLMGLEKDARTGWGRYGRSVPDCGVHRDLLQSRYSIGWPSVSGTQGVRQSDQVVEVRRIPEVSGRTTMAVRRDGDAADQDVLDASPVQEA